MSGADMGLHDVVYLQLGEKIGPGGGDVMSWDTSAMGSTIQAVTYQSQGTTRGQDDRIIGVSLIGPYDANKLQDYGTDIDVAIATQGLVPVRVANDNSAIQAGDIVMAEQDDQTLYQATWKSGDQIVFGTASNSGCGVVDVESWSTWTKAGMTGNEHVSYVREKGSVVGYAWEDEGAGGGLSSGVGKGDTMSDYTDGRRIWVLLRLQIPCTAATA